MEVKGVDECMLKEYLEKEDQQFLVNLYVDNRYARPERVHITDDDVEVCRNVK